MFLFIAVLVGVIIRGLAKHIKLPYTVVLLILGVALGAMDTHSNLGLIGSSISYWMNLSGGEILIIFLPALIFGSAASVDYHIFSREIPQILLLAFPGVVISAVLTALFAMYAMPYDWGWPEAMAFGSMLSATDPVAVVALLRELGASKRLSLLIEGESLFNDGSAYVLFIVFRDSMAGVSRDAAAVTGVFSQLAIGGAVLGLVVGGIVVFFLNKLQFDVVGQITITLLSSYLVFMAAESTPLHVSGVLAVVCLGLTMAASGKTTVRDHEAMHTFWEMIEYIANTVVFVVAGVIMYERGFIDSHIGLADWGHLIALYLVLHVVRAVVLFVLKPALSKMGYGLSTRELFVVSYSGLRGAVGLVLALLVSEDSAIPEATAARFLFHMAGVATLTLVVNGTTTGFLLRKLGLVRRSLASQLMFGAALRQIRSHSTATSDKLRHHEFYHDADWGMVNAFLPTVLGALQKKLAAVQAEAHQEVADRATRHAWVQQQQMHPAAAGMKLAMQSALHKAASVFGSHHVDTPAAPAANQSDFEREYGAVEGRAASPPVAAKDLGVDTSVRHGLSKDQRLLVRSQSTPAKPRYTDQETVPASSALGCSVHEDSLGTPVPVVLPTGQRTRPQFAHLAMAGTAASGSLPSASPRAQSGGSSEIRKVASMADVLAREEQHLNVLREQLQCEASGRSDGLCGAAAVPCQPDGREDTRSSSRARREHDKHLRRIQDQANIQRNSSGRGVIEVTGRGGSAYGSSLCAIDVLRGSETSAGSDGDSVVQGGPSSDHEAGAASDSSDSSMGTQRAHSQGSRGLDTQAAPQGDQHPNLQLRRRGSERPMLSIDTAAANGAMEAGEIQPALSTAAVVAVYSKAAQKGVMAEKDVTRSYIEEARHRFLNLLKAHYWEMFEAGMVSRAAVTQLLEAASTAQDNRRKVLHDWHYLERFFQGGILRDMLSSFERCGSQKFLFHMLSFEFDVAATFIEAHKGVERLFTDVVENREVAALIMAESRHQVKLAQRVVQNIQDSFTEITRAIKTKHVMYALVKDTENTAKRLLQHGEIEQKEYEMIEEAVMCAWHAANLPTTIVADEATMLREVGYLQSLDSRTFRTLYSASKRKVFEPGAVIAPQGTRQTGFHIVLRGTVSVFRRQEAGAAEGEDAQPAEVAGNDERSNVIKAGRSYTLSGSASRVSEILPGRISNPRAGWGSALGSVLRQNLTPPREEGGPASGCWSKLVAQVKALCCGCPCCPGARKRKLGAFHSSSLRSIDLEVGHGDAPKHAETAARSHGLGAEIDHMSKGGVIGLLSMLTGAEYPVSAVADTHVVTVHISQRDIFTLLKSKPSPTGGPLRRVTHLEETLCRMAAVLIAETLLKPLSHLRPAQIRAMLAESRLVRPEGKRGVVIHGPAVLLTGAELIPVNPEQVVEAEHNLARARAAQQGHPAEGPSLGSESALRSLSQQAGTEVSTPVGPAAVGQAAPAQGTIVVDRTSRRAGSALQQQSHTRTDARDPSPGSTNSSIVSKIGTFFVSLVTPRAAGARHTHGIAGFGADIPVVEMASTGEHGAGADPNGFDPNYHAKAKQSAGIDPYDLPDSEFTVHKRAFHWLECDPSRVRYFTPGSRLLVIPQHFAQMYGKQHSQMLMQLQAQGQARYGKPRSSHLPSTRTGTNARAGSVGTRAITPGSHTLAKLRAERTAAAGLTARDASHGGIPHPLHRQPGAARPVHPLRTHAPVPPLVPLHASPLARQLQQTQQPAADSHEPSASQRGPVPGTAASRASTGPHDEHEDGDQLEDVTQLGVDSSSQSPGAPDDASARRSIDDDDDAPAI